MEIGGFKSTLNCHIFPFSSKSKKKAAEACLDH